MRVTSGLLASLLYVACATPGVSPRVGRDVEISFSRNIAAGRPILVVAITNRSRNPICIRAEVLENPYSYEIDLRLRDARGRTVQSREPGFLPPPLEGFVRVEPGGMVRGQYYLDSRFEFRRGAEFRRRLSVQSAFRYGYCEDATSFEARSGWQPI